MQIPEIHRTDIPGLYDIKMPDGRELRDVTTGQAKQILAEWRRGRPPSRIVLDADRVSEETQPE